MAARDEILAYADELLEVASYPDYGPIGLQVAGASEVTKIVCAVSASLELFHRAGELGAQLVVVHHGLFWDNEPRVVDERMRRRLQALFDGDITLAAYHLALDAHPEVGNNALLARELGIEPERPFGGIGFGGPLAEPASVGELARRLEVATGAPPLVFGHGPDVVESAAVITGGGARYAATAAAEGYDAFVTGEPAEPSLHTAKELGLHFLAGGHYATERLGVQALTARLAERFALEWEFVELPNPV